MTGRNTQSGFRIGVDIGGTFTDFTVIGDDGSVTLWKEPSTPLDPKQAITTGLRALADMRGGGDLGDYLSAARLFVHGTTIATNIVIQRSGPEIGLLCTAGFRDVLYYRDGFKRERFNLRIPRSAEFVPRYLRLGVPERMLATGEVELPLDEAAVRHAAERFRAADVEAVAVAFLWSVANDIHERRAAEILREELPGVYIVESIDVLPEMREWERTSAASLSAYVLPAIAEYLRSLQVELGANGLASDLLVMQINGGCARVDEVLKRPVSVLASGPAAAPAAALHHATELGDSDAITVDMGGTSFDVCVIRDGRPAISRETRVDDQPVGVPAVEVHSVGAGGGSIAWIDGGGALRVGPQSAGATPGPAAYALGGNEPTVTDANVLLGYLSPDAFLGGRRTLDAGLAEAAVQRVLGGPLGIPAERAATGILRVVDSNMVNAIREVSVQRGIDPRRFVLVAGGGAGGLHAGRIARALGVTRVLVPREAGTLCAFGMAVTDIRHDYSTPAHQRSDSLDLDAVQSIFEKLEARALADLTAQGFVEEEVTLERSVDARYPGQLFELTVVVPSTVSDKYGAKIESEYHREHARLYTFYQELSVEVLHWRVTATGRARGFQGQPGHTDAEPTLISADRSRLAYYDDVGWLSTDLYDAKDLSPGDALVGPAVIEADTTTILVQPGDRVTVTSAGNFLIEVTADRGLGMPDVTPGSADLSPVVERSIR